MVDRNPFPFRFGVQSRSAGPTRETWIETVRRVEALGYDTLMWPDHFVRGFEPVAAMAAAVMVTERLKVCGFVFDNDFRHPVVLAMSIGSIDILSDGRVELGIGAGWLKDEYDLSGIPFDPVGVRIARLQEAIPILKSLLSGERTSFQGEFYQVDGLQIPPVPGAETLSALDHRRRQPADSAAGGARGGHRRHHHSRTPRRLQGRRGRDRRGDRAQDRLGPRSRGRPLRPDRVEHHHPHGRDHGGSPRLAERLAADLPISAEEVLDSPAVLLGTVDRSWRPCRSDGSAMAFPTSSSWSR